MLEQKTPSVVAVGEADFWNKRLRSIINDPWSFATHCVRTKDEVDMANPIKPFPVEFDYLKIFFDIWTSERMIAVPKSRRMFMSWATLTLHLWDAMFHRGRNIAFVSKKEEDADQLILKAKFILDNIPESVLPRELRPVYKYKYCSLEFPELDSKIMGFPQGADQLRMFTFSRIMADEAAFWDKAEDMYSASIPTLEGGGCMTMISSPAPGFFKRLVFDQLDEAEEVPTPKKFHPMAGVEVWRNVKNKFVVFQLHYSANERKKDPSYRADLKATMPYHKYMQEYELSWETFSGKPVFPDWNKDIHGSKTEIEPELGLPLLLGIDQGLRPACLVCQQQGETFVVLKEYLAVNMGAERFAEYVKAKLRNDFPRWSRLKEDYIIGMDPTGFNRRDTDERAYSDVWRQAGFNPMPGENLFERRKQAVEGSLKKLVRGRAAFRVDLDNCPVLVRGFDGGYRYKDSAFEIEPDKIRPLKDDNADVQDALQYILTTFGRVNSKQRRKVPAPSYRSEKQGGDNGRIPNGTRIG